MENSPQRVGSTSDEFTTTFSAQREEDTDEVEAQPHIHLPNPSYWPVALGAAIALAMIGLLIINNTPWLFIISLPLILIAILGWALEDPMAPQKEIYVPVRVVVDTSKYRIGQNVVDSQGRWLGKVQARFPRYILVERGSILPKVYYVPQNAIKDPVQGNSIFLMLSENELERMELNRLPEDLYEETPEHGFPRVRGAAQFARRPLSPAETGHYNYGRMSPGINTDAVGSYHREEIFPTPQTYVTEEPVYVTDRPIPPREISPD